MLPPQVQILRQMSEEASGSNTRSKLRDIPSIDYKELHTRGGVCPIERFSSHRSVENNVETDSSSSSPYVSPLLTPTAQSESEDAELADQSSDITLRPSQLKTHAEIRMDQRKDNALVELASLSEDISDHLEENPVDLFVVIDDIDLSISKLEALRKQFRTNANLLKQLVGDEHYNEHYDVGHVKTKNNIKTYIQGANSKKLQLRQKVIEKDKQATLQQEQKVRSESSRDVKTANFLWTEVNRMIVDLAAIFATDIRQISNEELRRHQVDQ